MRDVIASVRVGHEGLGALGGPLHRSSDALRRPGDDDLLGVVEDLRAEAAAHVGRDHPELVLRDAHHERTHEQPDHVGILAARVERVAVVARVVLADRRARLDRVRHQPVLNDVELHHVCRLVERGLRRGLVAELPVVADVARHVVEDERRTVRRRRGDARHGGKRLVLHLDQGGRGLRLRLGLRDDDGDLISDVADSIHDERGVGRLVHRRAVSAVDLPAARESVDAVLGHLLAGQDGDHARSALGLRGVDASDRGVRLGGPYDIRMRLPRAVDVVRVPTLSGQEAAVFLAPKRGADPGVGHQRPPICAAAVWTALTMLW